MGQAAESFCDILVVEVGWVGERFCIWLARRFLAVLLARGSRPKNLVEEWWTKEFESVGREKEERFEEF
jgi:hypothetical protein